MKIENIPPIQLCSTRGHAFFLLSPHRRFLSHPQRSNNVALRHNREEDAEDTLRHKSKQRVCQQSVTDGLIHTCITS